jgi:hypothetical protein
LHRLVKKTQGILGFNGYFYLKIKYFPIIKRIFRKSILKFAFNIHINKSKIYPKKLFNSYFFEVVF